MAIELSMERMASEGATRTVKIFRSKVLDLRRQLDTRTKEVKIVQSQIMAIEVAQVWANTTL